MQIEVHYIEPHRIHVNPWNPNKMNGFMYGKAIESIRRSGFIDPITVRDVGPDNFQIIDGEHRYRAGVDLGLPLIPVISLGEMTDEDAKKLTVVLNELRGQALPGDMGDLLKDLIGNASFEEILDELPYTEDMLRGLTELPALPTLPEEAEKPNEPERRWVERLYRMPPAAAEVLDDAITKAKEQHPGTDVEDWQALEWVAAEFLAS